MGSRQFPLVRGRRMRVTRLDGCGRPVYGACGQVVTEGFISVALSAVINEGEAITVTTASGKTCVSDQPTPEFQGYTAELTFCDVDPDLFALITGQESVLDAQGDVVGFRMNADVDLDASGFALEVWAGVPGVACDPNAPAPGSAAALLEPAGYLLLPFLKGGVLGDFTIENAAVNFTVTGAATKGGSGWGVGPYDVVTDGAGNPSPLLTPITSGDHLHVQYVEVPAPHGTFGCAPLLNPAKVTGAGSITKPGNTAALKVLTLAPEDSTGPVDDAALAKYPVLVTWGDGEWGYFDGSAGHAVADMKHTYAAAGNYTVTIKQGGNAAITAAVTIA
jgi:hypothetical protein